MKIEFVCPSAEDSALLRSLAVAKLAALTPRHIQLSLKDDILKRLDPAGDLDFSVDLAAFSVSTKTASRAYQLAAAYRRRGIKVVMGGIHPTTLPDEALRHCDAVVVGEAEGLWEQLVDDLQRGRLQRLYRHRALPEYQRSIAPRWDLFTSAKYIPVATVQTSRGCPHDCEFCSVSALLGRRPRSREVEDISDELSRLDRRWVLFADDDIVAQPARARRLFQRLIPLKLTWFGQASVQGLADPATLALMAASGCKALFIGFESINPQSLAACGKSHNHPQHYAQLVKRLADHGIAVWAAFVLGLDHDGPESFEQTLEFVYRARPFMAQFAMQTPFPGSRLYQRLLQEGRLLDHQWWLRHERDDFPLFRPRKMTPEQLFQGWQWIWKECYRGRSILSRFPRATVTSLFAVLAYWPINLYQRQLTRAKILKGDKFFRRDG